ncbi:hypothetical protein, partial [Bacteroides fragilis]|uniref:hypothetical protein n=1 Tax=Bacteroides fragilis TaxID=817 RepID=UPI0039B4703A
GFCRKCRPIRRFFLPPYRHLGKDFFSDAYYFILFFTLAALPSAFPGNKKAEKGKERVGIT